MSVLHMAACHGNHEVCKFIMEQIECKNPTMEWSGSTPFHEAAENGHISLCELFINNTKDLKPLDHEGKTPFDLAKENGHKKICKLIKSSIRKQNDT